MFNNQVGQTSIFPWFSSWFSTHPRAQKAGGKAIAHPRDVHQPRALRAHVHEGAEVPTRTTKNGVAVDGKPWENHGKTEVFMGTPWENHGK